MCVPSADLFPNCIFSATVNDFIDVTVVIAHGMNKHSHVGHATIKVRRQRFHQLANTILTNQARTIEVSL